MSLTPGERFRVAEITVEQARGRVPLWLQRERAKKLLGAVERHGDFPMVVETWRTCLQDSFDLASLKRLLDELEAGEIGLSAIATASRTRHLRSVAHLRRVFILPVCPSANNLPIPRTPQKAKNSPGVLAGAFSAS